MQDRAPITFRVDRRQPLPNRVTSELPVIRAESPVITAVRISWELGSDLSRIRAKVGARALDGGRLAVPKGCSGLMLS